MEGHRVGQHRGGEVGHGDLGRLGVATTVADARILRQELVERGHAPREVGQVDAQRTDALLDAVDELLEGVGRTPPRRAQRDELAGDLGATALLDVPPRDETTHRVHDEDDAGIRPGAALRAQPLERRLDHGAQALPVVAVGQAPVIGEGDEVRRLGSVVSLVAELLEGAHEHVIAPDRRPDPWQHVNVGHEGDRLHSVVGRSVPDAFGERLPEDGSAPRQQLPDSTGARCPDEVLARGRAVGPPDAESAPGDARKHHDQVVARHDQPPPTLR